VIHEYRSFGGMTARCRDRGGASIDRSYDAVTHSGSTGFLMNEVAAMNTAAMNDDRTTHAYDPELAPWAPVFSQLPFADIPAARAGEPELVAAQPPYHPTSSIPYAAGCTLRSPRSCER